ncbi:Ubiquitin-like protein [Mycena sanguinolenta]|uniref:Ubiquitin-like protein n=1 Tax=Mycena sanguinolenta TaxID=230812 RepID=A0A8H7DI54_9AGAR|nr:Ubiquitin-like protein [Mycena sanguinolenta]
MTASGEDVKPDVSSKVRIIVQFNDTKLTFLTKRNKPLAKLLDTFCEKIGVDKNSNIETVKFNFDGANVTPDATAEDLGIEDDDEVIDGQIFQEGGHLI